MSREAAGVASIDTLHQIDFHDVLAIVAARCASAPGSDRIRARRPVADPERVRADISLVAELVGLLKDGDRFRSLAIEDLHEHLEALAKDGGVLDAPVLSSIGQAMTTMRRTAVELERIGSDAPRVAALRADVPPKSLEDRLTSSFEADGSIRDDASADLKKARNAVRNTRSKLVSLLEGLARDVAEGDGTVTMRNGRYVVSVPRTSKSSVRGIVHGESASGATVFVEPQKAVTVGNELQSAEAAEKRAELAVLRDLSERCRAHLGPLLDSFEMCVAVDDLYARARYAVDVESTIPDLVDAPDGIRINQGRHPILLAELPAVVPFSLEAGPTQRVVLISGPNTGGKTVLLKAVALFSAMAQSGIVPPLGPKSQLPVFSNIMSDIGDHQSIADSLSTYGAHLRAARSILETAGSGALVLIDELGTGTDPAEGAALAGAMIQTLCERRCFTIATTHLGQLKQIAADTDGVSNASLLFDPDRLEPTYKFQMDVPGRSYGLALARRLGLPEDVLARAESLRGETERSLESLLADLEAREKELDAREEQVRSDRERQSAEREGLDTLKRSLEDEQDAVVKAKRNMEVEGREEARRYLLDARKKVEEALGMARAAVTETTAREARKLVEQGVKEEASAIDRLEEQAEKQGWTIKVGSSERKKKQKTVQPKSAPRVVRRAAPIDTQAATEIDLRGMTGDEAELVVQRALDDAVVDGLTTLRIIHGKGTGALRERVAALLKQDRRVSAAETASSYEGGWGVTIAKLKS